MSEHKHDGKLKAIASEQYMAEIEIFDHNPASSLVLLSGGYGADGQCEVYLDPKQALSLLAWLRQEEQVLEKLAKEQGE